MSLLEAAQGIQSRNIPRHELNIVRKTIAVWCIQTLTLYALGVDMPSQTFLLRLDPKSAPAASNYCTTMNMDLQIPTVLARSPSIPSLTAETNHSSRMMDHSILRC